MTMRSTEVRYAKGFYIYVAVVCPGWVLWSKFRNGVSVDSGRTFTQKGAWKAAERV